MCRFLLEGSIADRACITAKYTTCIDVHVTASLRFLFCRCFFLILEPSNEKATFADRNVDHKWGTLKEDDADVTAMIICEATSR